MLKRRQYIFLFFIFLLGWKSSYSQGANLSAKNSFSFNLTGCFINEINLGFERRISNRKSLEIDGGIIFVNNFLVDQTKNWNNSLAFSEHGYAARVHYKIFAATEAGTKKWRDYISPGLLFKHLYYNELLLTNEFKDYHGTFFEYINQSRIRTKLGLEFLWGKVYEVNRTCSFDFFYGGGVVANFVEKKIIQRIPDSRKNEIVDVNKIYNSIYFRPYATLGLKFSIRF